MLRTSKAIKPFFIIMIACTIAMLFVFSSCQTILNALNENDNTKQSATKRNNINNYCSTLTTDSLIYKDINKPTDDEYYSLVGSLQCCNKSFITDIYEYEGRCIYEDAREKMYQISKSGKWDYDEFYWRLSQGLVCLFEIANLVIS